MIQFRDSTIHGRGGFAALDIATGTRVVEYAGQKINKTESLRRCELNNPFIFSLDAESDLDGDVEWNQAKWLNHSCAPNCEAELIDGRIWIVAKRDIQAGEEVTFNYAYDLESFREHPCHCRAPNCVGYIVAEDYHAQLRILSCVAAES